MQINGTQIRMIRGDSESLTVTMQDDKNIQIPFIDWCSNKP